jgi:hypothetical protein
MRTRKLQPLVFTLCLAGCTTPTPVPFDDANPAAVLQAGDEVRLCLKDGKRLDMRITSVSTKGVCGSGECARAEDIATVEKREFSPLRTFFLVMSFAGFLGIP